MSCCVAMMAENRSPSRRSSSSARVRSATSASRSATRRSTSIDRCRFSVRRRPLRLGTWPCTRRPSAPAPTAAGLAQTHAQEHQGQSTAAEGWGDAVRWCHASPLRTSHSTKFAVTSSQAVAGRTASTCGRRAPPRPPVTQWTGRGCRISAMTLPRPEGRPGRLSKPFRAEPAPGNSFRVTSHCRRDGPDFFRGNVAAGMTICLKDTRVYLRMTWPMPCGRSSGRAAALVPASPSTGDAPRSPPAAAAARPGLLVGRLAAVAARPRPARPGLSRLRPGHARLRLHPLRARRAQHGRTGGLGGAADGRVRRGYDRRTSAGNSMGCQVALSLARRHPERVAGLILLGPTTGKFTGPVLALRAGPAAGRLRRVARVQPEAAADVLPDGPAALPGDGAAHDADDPLAHAGEVRAPCLVTRGGNDRIVPEPSPQGLAAMLPPGSTRRWTTRPTRRNTTRRSCLFRRCWSSSGGWKSKGHPRSDGGGRGRAVEV